MEYTVYVLVSLRDNRKYIGVTRNIARRLLEHQGGKVRSTAKRLPMKLIYTETYSSQKEAYTREKYYKTGKGREELKKLLNKNTPVAQLVE